MRNGSERVVTSAREHIYDLRSLENYTFTDENGRDQGINVRHKVSNFGNTLILAIVIINTLYF